MIAYNKTKLLNQRLLKKAKEWYAQRLLTDEQLATITNFYKAGFYSPNLFIKIGLFVFTWFSVLAAVGLFALVYPFYETNAAIATVCFLFSAACVFLLEFLIRHKRLFRSGIDEALLYAALIFAGSAIASVLPFFENTDAGLLWFCLFFSPLLLVAAMRYADALVAILLMAGVYIICFLLIKKIGSPAKFIMPFAMMALSALVFFVIKKKGQNQKLKYWQTLLSICECVSLLCFYGAGNYYVVREAAIRYFNVQLNRGEDVPLAFFFYSFTAIIPVLYVVSGLKNKDRILLWTGMATAALSGATLHYYFFSQQPELPFVVEGLILIVIAYLITRYLKAPRHGITFEEDAEEDNFLKTNAEALLQGTGLQQAAQTPQTQAGFEFGGGSSGGGGATGRW